MFHFENDWDKILGSEFSKPYYQALHLFLKEEYENYTIYPPMIHIFDALKLSSYQDTKVVIVGQDPYHEPNQAHGLAFSVQDNIDVPPSLLNIYKEIECDLGIQMKKRGNLSKWASQGVLLLNNVLTVRAHCANSHKGKGWEQFTDTVISSLNQREEPVIFVFWGNNAKAKKSLITERRHLVLEAPHPSPLSAYHGFFGCRHFSKINDFLIKNGKEPIDWQIE